MKPQQILLISDCPLITPGDLLRFHYFFLLLFLLFIAECFGSTASYPLRPGFAQSMSLSVFLLCSCIGKGPVFLAQRCLSRVVVLQFDVVVFFLDKYAEFSSLRSFGHEKNVDFPELQMLYLELLKISDFFMTRVDASWALSAVLHCYNASKPFYHHACIFFLVSTLKFVYRTSACGKLKNLTAPLFGMLYTARLDNMWRNLEETLQNNVLHPLGCTFWRWKKLLNLRWSMFKLPESHL